MKRLLRVWLLIFSLFTFSPIFSNADPLDNWHWRNPLPQGNSLSGVSYGNGTFVAVGDIGTVLTSSDGATWTVRTSGTRNYLRGVAYGNNTFVAVGDAGTVLTSPDGATWTTRTSGSSNDLYGVTYANGIFVAVGLYAILISPDGITWTVRTLGHRIDLRGITFGNSTFVAVGFDWSVMSDAIVTSSDGMTWTIRTSGIQNYLEGVAYGNNTFVAVGGCGTIIVSNDAVIWTVISSETTCSSSNGIKGIVYGNNTFVAITSMSWEILISHDGVNWINMSLLNIAIMEGISYINNLFITVGDGGTILTSPDGLNWTERTSGTKEWFSGVTYGKGVFVAVSYSIFTSNDGTAWIKTNERYSYRDSVTYGNSIFVAVGCDGLIITSPDGLNWTERSSPTKNRLRGITFGNNNFVAVGDDGTILTSTNGINWMSASSNYNKYLFSVTYGNNLFVAVGGDWDKNGIILSSPDGIVWTVRMSGTYPSLFGVTFGNNTFVAVGGGKILTSSDGVSWTDRASATTYSVYGIAYGNSTFVAVGNEIVTSSNAINWTTRTSVSQLSSLRGITYGNRTFVAVGIYGTILQSDPVTKSPWPMFRHDLQHTGQSPYLGAPINTLKWKFKTDGWVDSSPAIGSDGTIYVGSRDCYLYAINPDGTLKWKFGTSDLVDSSPAIGSDGTIYVGSWDSYLYAINPDGTLKWKFGTSDLVDSSPAIGSDGTIYVGSDDSDLYAINPDGTLKWKFRTGDWIRSSPAIGSDGMIYVGSGDYYLYAINPDGTLKWKFGTGGRVDSSPAIGSDGTIYVGSGDYYLYAINPDGTLKWKFKIGDVVLSSPAIGSDGTIYVGSLDGYLYAIGPGPIVLVPDITVTPTSINFGNVNVGSSSDRSVMAKNDGNADLLIGAITNPVAPFSKVLDNCSNQTLIPGATCIITYRFSPIIEGNFLGNSNIPSNDPDENPVTVTLIGSGVTALSTFSGIVFDSSSGSRLSGVLIRIADQSAATNAMGEYSIQNISAGSYTLTASKDGYYTHTESVTVPGSTSLKININLKPIVTLGEIKILSVASKYRGFVYYLDGVDHNVTYTANIDWGGHPPGTVEFKTPKGTHTETATGVNVSHTFNMGTDFGPCGKLTVVAKSSDGTRSSEVTGEFVVMQNPFISWPLRSWDWGDGFYYKLDTGINVSFFEKGVDAGIIPKEIPLFGDSPFRLDFIPQISQEVTSGGEASLTFSWEDLEAGKIIDESWGREHNLAKIIALLNDYIENGRVDKRRLPKAGMAGFEINLYPMLNFEGQFNPSECKWGIGGYIGLAGGLELKKSWPFIIMAGPIPVPMYAKASLEVSANVQGGATGWPPQENLNGKLQISPYARGSLGAGVDEFLSVEGWIGGGADFGLQWPEEPTLEELTIYLNGGISVYALFWKWEQELLKWDWEYVKSGQGATVYKDIPQDLRSRRMPKLIERDYLRRPDYGRFNRKPALKITTGEVGGKKYSVATGALQSTVFPYSKASLSSSGTNFYLTYLYDDPNRTSMNRTMAVFSSWEGTQWSDPVPIGDDGTADFSPQILVFSDGSAMAAWEDVKTSLPETATFEEMVANLEISVARYDPVSKQWSSPVRLTSNGYLDRTPRLAGKDPNNVMLTWISNEANNILGSASEPNKIWYSLWDGSQWSSPQMVSQIGNGIVKISSMYDGQKGYLTMSLDTDDNSETIGDHELFNISYESGAWSAPVRLTNDTLADDNPQLGIDPNGHFILSWVKGNELVTAIDFDMNNRETITTNEYSTSFADFRMATGSNGRLAILWAEASENDSDIYAVFYDPIFETWGKPKQLTFDKETERHIAAAFYGNATLMAVYNRVQMGTSQITRSTPSGKMVSFTIPKPGETDLYILRYGIGADLGFKTGSLVIDPPNPVPGTGAKLSVTATNLGEVAITNIPVAFYNGNPSEGGTEIGRTSITEILNPGGNVTVSINWIVPETKNPLDIYAVIDPDQQIEDRDRTNNVVNGRFIKSDLSIQSANWSLIGANLISITVRVINQGAIPSPEADITFMLGAKNGTLLSNLKIPGLDRYSATDVNFLWDVSANLPTYRLVYATVDESSLIDDFDRTNNTMMVVISIPLAGDCNRDGQTTIDEVQKAINQYLGVSPVQSCCDLNGDGEVTIDELQRVINAFLGL